MQYTLHTTPPCCVTHTLQCYNQHPPLCSFVIWVESNLGTIELHHYNPKWETSVAILHSDLIYTDGFLRCSSLQANQRSNPDRLPSTIIDRLVILRNGVWLRSNLYPCQTCIAHN